MNTPYKCKACGLGTSHSGKGMLFGFMWKCPSCGCRETIAVDRQPKFRVGDRVISTRGERVFGEVCGFSDNATHLVWRTVRTNGAPLKQGQAAIFYGDPDSWELWRPKPGDWVDIDGSVHQSNNQHGPHYIGCGKVVCVDPLDGGPAVVCVNGGHRMFPTCHLIPILDPGRALKKSDCRQCFPLQHPYACCPVCKGPWDRAVGSYPTAEAGKRCTCCGALKPVYPRCPLCGEEMGVMGHPGCSKKSEHTLHVQHLHDVQLNHDLQYRLANTVEELADFKSRLAGSREEAHLLECKLKCCQAREADLLTQNQRLGQQVRELGTLVGTGRPWIAWADVRKTLQDCYSHPTPLLFFAVKNEPMMGVLEEFTVHYSGRDAIDWTRSTLKVRLLHQGVPVTKTFYIKDVDYLAPGGKVADVISSTMGK